MLKSAGDSSGERPAGNIEISKGGWLDHSWQPQVRSSRSLLSHWDWFEAVRYLTLWQVRRIFLYLVSVLFKMIVRYLRIKYEDFVQKPFESLNQLYNFAGLRIKPNIYQTLWDKTHGNRQEILIMFVMLYLYFQFWFLRYRPWTKFWSKSLEVRLQSRGDQSHRGELSPPDVCTKLFNL